MERQKALSEQRIEHIKRAISRVVVSRRQALSIRVEGLLVYIG